MTAVPFDTLKMVERLEGAGVPTAQAKVQAAVLAEVITAEDASIAERFAGKTDAAQELVAIRMAVEKLDSKITESVANAKSDLVKWVVSVGILQMALIAGLVIKLVH